MGNYKIKVNVEIVESKDTIMDQPNKTKEGCFEFTIPEADAISIGRCEKALLETNYEAIRDAISRHLGEVSKKNT
jgi:hypothetical protein